MDDGCALCLSNVANINNWFSAKVGLCRPCAHEVVRRFDRARPQLMFWDKTYFPLVRAWVHAEIHRVLGGDKTNEYTGILPGDSLDTEKPVEIVPEVVSPAMTKKGQYSLF